MAILTREQRNQLSKVVLEAREIAEAAARKALHSLGVGEADAPSYLSAEQRTLRRALRAQARQLGDKEDLRKKGSYDLYHLTEKVAYDQWHRMLFARFLAENELLISPDHGVAVTLAECRELAPEIGLKDEWEVAIRFAAGSLPQIFRPDDPAGKIELAPEDRASLRDSVLGLSRGTFLANDSLGWSYQFWQTKRKKDVNDSGDKIGADELPAVTQLFTEDYMVDFLLDNTLGAWHAARSVAVQISKFKVSSCPTEEAARKLCALPGVEWKYLRFVKKIVGGEETWAPAAGGYDWWPKTAKELKCLDPCMGSGHFVVAMFERLVALRMAEEALDEKEIVAAVTRHNLFGLEIDPRCTQIAAFNLALAAWRRVGYCGLPAMNLACSGLAPNSKLEDWLKIAGGDQKLQRGMERLYGLFQKAAMLGSLINPRAREGDLLVAAFHELQPLLEKALTHEAKDETTHEMAVTARGLAKAAEILADQFTLVATNVPYLGRGKQTELLMNYCEDEHPEGKADLATCFIERSMSLCAPGGTSGFVTKQEWLFLGKYLDVRKRSLEESSWGLVARLGPRAFETISGERVNVSLHAITIAQPSGDGQFFSLDVSSKKTPAEKGKSLVSEELTWLSQSDQLKNPDSRVTTEASTYGGPTFGIVAESYQGIVTGDLERFRLKFWELASLGTAWVPFRTTISLTGLQDGSHSVLHWEEGAGSLHRYAVETREQLHDMHESGNRAWGRPGIAINRMSGLQAALYYGEHFDNNVAVLIPREQKSLTALLSYCVAPQFVEQVKKLDRTLKVTNKTLVKVPFDVEHWQKVAAEKYPHGLLSPFSSDPTQWLFNGHPKGSNQSLQVAVARLVGYQWPRQAGSSLSGCPSVGPDGLEKLADDDGIVCINPIKGEQPAAERLRALLAAAFGAEWTPGKQNELLEQEQVGFGGKTLEDWLRNGFFEQHCQLFHQRPFIWHIWDGRRDGFSALVNYHKLNRSNLEKLTYTFLGDWIARQKAANDAGEEGSDARLQAALELKSKLEKIIEGDAPFDIFVRWKPIEKQPIGWEPDLNDGVRMNIRPFVAAGVLRKDPKINWKKDRGKDVGTAPWYKVFKGERINDCHLKLEEKRKAHK